MIRHSSTNLASEKRSLGEEEEKVATSSIFNLFSIVSRAWRVWILESFMAAKMKGMYSKGFKCISQIFDVKDRDRDMQIGYPTDVKHVAHIGWDGASGTAPTWMNDYKAGADLSSPRSSFVNQRHSNSFGHSIGASQGTSFDDLV